MTRRSITANQAAEKAIKGFLVFSSVLFAKTHDLRYLVGLAVPHQGNFADFFDIADMLTPDAIAYRYPGEFDEPEPEHATEALKSAEKVCSFVLSLIPPECHPSSVSEFD